ncbi:uncharacterized protein LOC123513168 isoform X1 [Portunus trituberculatus]|uniref:uncharacterized protein LOC123513168 isoform X1 n=2 Tax=Portunus trituberculatus TaxID=210409 RepID=UPI001E1D0CF3|nr:uncharacterized protein LOC123513168 isoform X1 [Portunus trituberculatus]
MRTSLEIKLPLFKINNMKRSSSVRVWVWRLWAVGALQETVETLFKVWLVGKFRSPYMCRVSVTDGKWCMVPSLTQAAARRVPAWMCQYDAWCGEHVFLETAPPLITRLTVLLVALFISLLVVWAPRLLIYRPSHPLLVWIRRQTPRRVLLLVAVSAVLQLTLDHCLLALLLPPRFLLSHPASLLSFTIAQFLITVALVKQIRRSSQLNINPHIHVHHMTTIQEEREPLETATSRPRASYHLANPS